MDAKCKNCKFFHKLKYNFELGKGYKTSSCCIALTRVCENIDTYDAFVTEVYEDGECELFHDKDVDFFKGGKVIMKNLYVYAAPDQMQEHKFSDDVAITYAETKEEALTNFRKLYDITIDDVELVSFNDFGVAILTDY